MKKVGVLIMSLAVATAIVSISSSVAALSWSTFPFCYKNLGPAVGSPQVLIAPTCNSGAFCTPEGCVPVADCGPGGAACTVGYGCLNTICTTNNAIWDPVTHICGCDSGIIRGGGVARRVITSPPAAPAQTPAPKVAPLTPTACTNTAAQGDLADQVVTNYYPIRGAGDSEGTEGGDATKWAGPDGKYKPRTLEMFRLGQSQYISLASDASMVGKSYIIPEITYAAYRTDAAGNFVRGTDGNYIVEKHTLTNVPAYVHDTGSFFKGRPDKFDLATQVLPKGQGLSTSRLDGAQPARMDTLFKPATGVGTSNPTCVSP